MPSPRIRFRGISKTYPGVRALDGVGFDVAPGSVHALVGENGAGKSTLMKVLAGATRPDSGSIELDGGRVDLRDARHARSAGVAIVYQEFNLVRDLSVSENIYLGRWPRSPWTRMIRFAELHARARALLSSLGIALPVTRSVAGLSIAQQQMVEIARALSLDARILVLDEPSAVLTPHELTTLFRVVRDARQRGVSILYISHRLDEIFEIADAVTVLRDGRQVSTRPIADVQRHTLIAEMVGRPLTDEFPGRNTRPGEVVLRVTGLSAGRRFRDVSFDIRAGEILGLTGLVGAGRSSVARTIFGDVRATAGSVGFAALRPPCDPNRPSDQSRSECLPPRSAGMPTRCMSRSRFRNPRQAIAAGVAYLPEDRKLEGLLLERPLRENISLPYRDHVATAGFFRPRAERALAQRLMAELRIRAVSCETRVGTLSGGNQQKVLLARWMSRPQRVILLDEPTRGVDVGAKYEIYLLMNRLAAAGVAMLMISSELPEVIGMSDRIGVMHEGRLAGILDNARRDVTQEQIMLLASGE